jgi:3-phosphoshikimate 1-carboxyvinyltransferase
MSAPDRVVIRPARAVSGSIALPGDKSISHRYAMLGALAEGETRLQNFSTGADCASTLHCLRALGVSWEQRPDALVIHGTGQLQASSAALDCGNSGSTLRMLSGILAGQSFNSQLVGDASLSRRPMARVIAPLEMMGASIEAAQDKRPPLKIDGARLRAIDYNMPLASAQVKTSVLFAGLLADGETRITEPLRTRDHGEIALRAFGAQVDQQGKALAIRGGQKLHPIEATVPGDLSSAAFFLCAAGILPGSQLAITGLLLNPTRARLLDILTSMGLAITIAEIEEQHGELRGSIQIDGRGLKGGSIAGADTAALIDEIPVLAAIAPYTQEGIDIRDARELRVKESDRIAALARNLRAMGAELEEFEDGLRIPGNQKLRGAELDSFGDHRIAMAFAVAALKASGETTIKGSSAAVISFPEFFNVLRELAQR